MGVKCAPVSALLTIVVAVIAVTVEAHAGHSYFPNDFMWGVASSAYQIEGAAKVDGRGPSVWDTFSSIPGKIADNSTGEVACDHYNRYKEDIRYIKKLGVKVYRFSISWSRILPQGRGEVNQAGIDFYNRLIDELIANGITPFVTLFHWDSPTALEFEIDGWRNAEMQKYFVAYAEICFKHFGDRVKYWLTLNEPYVYALLGYGIAMFPPDRRGNVEPYVVAHNLLLAHAKAVDLYRTKYKPTQRGVIGISNNCDWRHPATNTKRDRDAAERGLEFMLGWFADPIYFGRYPRSMVRNVGDRLPKFTPAEARLLRGSSDFFALNHYTTHVAKYTADRWDDATSDLHTSLAPDPRWPKTDMPWFTITPWGFRRLLGWIKKRYGNPEIYVTENGIAVPGEDDVRKATADRLRVNFYRAYINNMRWAMTREGVRVKGYMAWSILDNFEWAEGYTKRFGLVHVDYKTQKRTPKASFWDYRRIIRGGRPWPRWH